MDQLKRLLGGLSIRQRIFTAAIALLVGAGLFSLLHWRKEADFKPLYTGLAPEDSAAVVAKLKEAGAEYRLSEASDVISVPSAKMAELRLDMAAAGLPKTGRIGFEIFDKNNLGATEFVEHINYRRALEGELERSVGGLAEVEQARVHITFPKDSVFLESREPAKASVMVKLRDGAHLSPRNVSAIGHLVGSAVEGLTPDAVSVLDMQGNLLSRPIRTSEVKDTEEELEYRQKVERDLVQKINTTLDPLLGRDRYRASVSADCDANSGELSEETVDPSRSVMVQSQKTEELMAGTGSSAAGIPGTASNLPRPAPRTSATSGNTNTHRTESITYESSRTIRKTKLAQGALRRLSVAVLLDQAIRWEGAGSSARRILTPPTAETMKSVHDLVAAAVGFVQDRGDQITIEALPFENTLSQPPPDSPVSSNPQRNVAPKPFDWKHQPLLLPIAAGVVVLILVAAAIIIMLVNRKKKKKLADVEHTHALPGQHPPHSLEAGPNMEDQIHLQMAERDALQQQADNAALASIKVPPVKTKKAEVLVKQLRENAKKDPNPSLHVLQTWLHDR
jgi:flagellar M-ring protein FliF